MSVYNGVSILKSDNDSIEILPGNNGSNPMFNGEVVIPLYSYDNDPATWILIKNNAMTMNLTIPQKSQNTSITSDPTDPSVAVDINMGPYQPSYGGFIKNIFAFEFTSGSLSMNNIDSLYIDLSLDFSIPIEFNLSVYVGPSMIGDTDPKWLNMVYYSRIESDVAHMDIQKTIHIKSHGNSDGKIYLLLWHRDVTNYWSTGGMHCTINSLSIVTKTRHVLNNIISI